MNLRIAFFLEGKMSTSQSSAAREDQGCSLIYSPQYCRCGKQPPIRIVQSERSSKGKLYCKCDDCGYFGWLKPTNGIQPTVGSSVGPRIINHCGCGCGEVIQKVKALEAFVGIVKVGLVAIVAMGVLTIWLK